jgi:hypothetical protein
MKVANMMESSATRTFSARRRSHWQALVTRDISEVSGMMRSFSGDRRS